MVSLNKDIHTQYIQGLKSGSYSDFNKLYSIYSDLLYGFVLNLTKSPSDAKDVLQETFLRIWQKRQEISEDMSFKSYLFTIAKNLIIDSLRKQIDNVHFDSYIKNELLQQSENSIEDNINFDDFMERLNAAKGKLTFKQKEVFELNKEKGLSIDQIAEKLDLSEKTVKNQLSLALKIIREELAPYHLILFVLLFN